MVDSSVRLADVSVVMPTFNRRDLLAAALDGIEALTPGPAEVVVVSDGSTDGTDELVRARGVTLLHTDHRGPGAARNEGWRSCTGDVVAFLDDDCVPAPSWLDELVQPFADASVGLVQGRTLPAGPVGRYDRTIEVWAETGLYESCNIAYRRSALERTGGFDEARFERLTARMVGRGRGAHFGEDTHLGWQVRRAGWQTVYAAEAVVRHHVFPGTFTDALREEWRSGNFALLIGEVPELRALLPGGRYFLRRHDPLVHAALLGTLLALAGRRRAGVLALPYLAWLVANRRGRSAVEQALRDAVRSAGLVVGSARARHVVL